MRSIERDLEEAMGALPHGGPPGPALEAVAARAGEEGLLDVAYAQVDSPFGPLTVAATQRGLVRVAYPDYALDAVIGDLASKLSPRVLEAPSRLDAIRRELEDYFEGRLRDFSSPIDWSLIRGEFTRRVLEVTARIDYGQVRTYAEVAIGAGSPRAVRAAGNGLGANPMPIVVPCHRVVRTGGGLGGYTGGLERKEFLLALESG